jgi:hypothetical protein
MFLFMEPTSPKGADLRRGSAYALHCGVEDNEGGGGEFLVRGKGQPINEPELRALAVAKSPYTPADRYVLFELNVESADATTYGNGGPVRQRWRAPA